MFTVLPIRRELAMYQTSSATSYEADPISEKENIALRRYQGAELFYVNQSVEENRKLWGKMTIILIFKQNKRI